VCWTVVAVCASLSSLHSVPGRYVTVAWDPSPDERVVGYAVYVGTAPGNYDKVFIVRNRTYFTYTDAVPERQYYFAVVAYTDSLVSEPSQAVSGYGQSTPALPVSGELSVPDVSSRYALNSSRGLPCTGAAGSGCYGTSIVASTEGAINALASTADGRVLLIEDGRRVRVFDGRTLSSDAALVAPPQVTFIGIAVDPRPDQRSRIYVAEAESGDGGTREVRIVRYRAVQDRLGEPAVIVGGLHVPEADSVPFTVDSNGRIFVAIPSVPTTGTPSPALVLGFESDGSALRHNRAASPIVASAPSVPTAIAWDDEAEQLWLAGIEGAAQTVVRIPMNPLLTSSDQWPRVPQPAALVSPDGISQRISARGSSQKTLTVIRMALGGRLIQVLPGANLFSEVSDFSQEETTATTTDRYTKSTFVAIRLRSESASYLYKIGGG
jgi:fibronectin type III domain protein